MMDQLNPFRVLQFTPGLVRMLKDKPRRLIEIAERHRRWMLAEVHPDRAVGTTELYQSLVSALQTVKDDALREQAVEEFLTSAEMGREILALRARDIEQELNHERAARIQEKEVLTKEVRRFEDLYERCRASLQIWSGAALLPPDEIGFRLGKETKPISLTGMLLLTGNDPRSTYLSCFFIGHGRRVYFHVHLSVKRVSLNSFIANPHTVHPPKSEQFILGSSLMGKELNLNLDAPVLAKLGMDIQPYLEIGKPIAILDRREDGDKLSVGCDLQKLIPGSLKKDGQKLRWIPRI